jgi:peptidoglycan hydrolase CwlO-like protein
MLKKILLFLLSVFFLISTSALVFAQDSTDKAGELEKQIIELSNKLKETQSKAATLINQITYMDSQIRLTTLKIQDTTEKVFEMQSVIEILTERIGVLENSLTNITSLLIDRVVATYKNSQLPTGLAILTSDGFSELISKAKYLRLVQSHDKKILFDVQSTKSDFESQKLLLEEKKKELDILKQKLETQKLSLDQQKLDKKYLLEVTKNDEKRYQQLLAQAKAEYEAIQAIIAGKGTETEVGKVQEGQRIASIIQGESCNSAGTHIHFMVTQNKSAQNPFNYLKSGIDYENCSGSGSCSEGDPFNPSGSWNWPINPKIKFNQGYGRTWAVDHTWVSRIYSMHNGIDINSLSSNEVKAVRNGILYRGSYNVGCTLRYVRVDHEDSDLDTLYLHINY